MLITRNGTSVSPSQSILQQIVDQQIGLIKLRAGNASAACDRAIEATRELDKEPADELTESEKKQFQKDKEYVARNRSQAIKAMLSDAENLVAACRVVADLSYETFDSEFVRKESIRNES